MPGLGSIYKFLSKSTINLDQCDSDKDHKFTASIFQRHRKPLGSNKRLSGFWENTSPYTDLSDAESVNSFSSLG